MIIINLKITINKVGSPNHASTIAFANQLQLSRLRAFHWVMTEHALNYLTELAAALDLNLNCFESKQKETNDNCLIKKTKNPLRWLKQHFLLCREFTADSFKQCPPTSSSWPPIFEEIMLIAVVRLMNISADLEKYHMCLPYKAYIWSIDHTLRKLKD